MPQLISPRERDVIELLSQGFSNVKIGKVLGIKTMTVKHHIRALMWKLAIEDRTRVTLALRWSCPIFRIGAGIHDP